MLIRSQKGNKLINFDMCACITTHQFADSRYILKCWYGNGNSVEVGDYKTYEIALKVINDLQNCIEFESLDLFIMPED